MVNGYEGNRDAELESNGKIFVRNGTYTEHRLQPITDLSLQTPKRSVNKVQKKRMWYGEL